MGIIKKLCQGWKDMEGSGRVPPEEESQDQHAPGTIMRISGKTPKEITLQEMTLIWMDKAELIYF